MQDRYSEIGFVQQILGLNLVPRKNVTNRGNDTSLSDFSGGFFFIIVASYCKLTSTGFQCGNTEMLYGGDGYNAKTDMWLN